MMYKLSDIDPNEETTCINLFICWKINAAKECFIRPCIIEHDKNYTWNEIKLVRFAERQQLFNIQQSPIEETWLVRDQVLKTSINGIHRGRHCQIEFTLSEATMNEHTKRPEWINSEE
jgi:hypothetical protein